MSKMLLRDYTKNRNQEKKYQCVWLCVEKLNLGKNKWKISVVFYYCYLNREKKMEICS